MYNREIIEIVVTSYSGEDEYGQMLSNKTNTRTIEGSFGLLNHNDTTDIRYQECTHYILTQDRNITDQDYLTIGDKTYKVVFVNNYGRLTEVFLR